MNGGGLTGNGGRRNRRSGLGSDGSGECARANNRQAETAQVLDHLTVPTPFGGIDAMKRWNGDQSVNGRKRIKSAPVRGGALFRIRLAFRPRALEG